MNMYITDKSWIFLNIPEPNKYTKIHYINEIDEYRFINHIEEEKQENNSISDKLLLNEEKNGQNW